MPDFNNDGRYTLREIQIYLQEFKNIQDAIDNLTEENVEHCNYLYEQQLKQEQDLWDFNHPF